MDPQLSQPVEQYQSHKQAEDPIRSFFKIILEFNIKLNKLRLPLKFVRKYSSELSDTAKFYVADGRVWELELKRERENIWFENGFREFSQHYSLGHGHLVYFKYKGTSNFSVNIHDKSSCEISYPSRNTSRSPPMEILKNHPKPAMERKRKDLAFSEYQSESGFLSPRHFNSKTGSPYFEVKLKNYNCDNNIVHVPAKFAEFHIKEEQEEPVKLEVCDGRQWNVSLKRNKKGRFHFGQGWKVFREENDLKVGDVCVFEFDNSKNNVFNVFTFVAVSKTLMQ